MRYAPRRRFFVYRRRARRHRRQPCQRHPGQIALIGPFEGLQKVAIYDLASSAPPQIVGMKAANAGMLYWKSDTMLIAVFHANVGGADSRLLDASTRAYAVDTATKKAALLMHDAPSFESNHGGGAVVDLDASDPAHVYLTETDLWDSKQLLDLYSVELASGNAHLVLHGEPGTIAFFTDGFGKVLGRLDQDWDLTDHVVMGGQDVYSYKVKGVDDFCILGLTADGVFAVRKPSASGTMGLYAWTPQAGIARALFEDERYDLAQVIRDERTGRIVGVTWIDDRPRARYFDTRLQHVQDAMEKAFPGQSVEIQSHDAAGAHYVISTDGPKNPPVFSLYTVANSRVDIVQEAYPGLKSQDLGDVRAYPYKARDGQAIQAYLTLPPGKAARDLPLVIFPHGGPESRSSLRFDWWGQYMATRGYAVLQPNYRGSSGYGRDFVRAGDGVWETKVQSDLQDGIDKLVAEGVADPRKICIVGGSYGGYLALAGASFSPHLYRCAESFAGISDLDRLVDEGTTFQSEAASVWRRRIGADREPGKLESASPVRFADKVTIPVLLIHSEKDATIPIQQSRLEDEALRRAGKQAELVVLDGDDHYLEFAATRTRLLTETERFLAKNLGSGR